MKKALMIVLTALLLTGCGSRMGGEAGNADETATGTAATEGTAMGVNTTAATLDRLRAAAGEVTEEDFTTKGYLIQGTKGTATYYLEVTNNSDKTVRVDIEGKGTCRDGQTADRYDTKIDVLGPGETSAAILYFTSPTTSSVASASYELSFDTNVACKPIISELAMEPYYNKDNVTVAVTNNSSEYAQRTQLLAIFLDENDNPLGTSMSYVSHDGFLAPGETNAVQLNVGDEARGYDHAEIVAMGVCGDAAHPVPERVDIGEKGLDIEEYRFTNESGSRSCLAITNKSDQTVAVTGNGSAKDADGKLLGASSFTTIDVLAPGETAYADLFFDGVSGAASVDYNTCCYVPDEEYKPIIGDLVPYVSEKDGALTIELSNVGKTVGESVWVHVLYFDESDKLIGIDYAFFDDADYELKAGKTIIQVLDTYRKYDHYKMFFSGKGKA